MRSYLMLLLAPLLAASTGLAQRPPSPVGVGDTVRIELLRGGTKVGVLSALGPTELSVASRTAYAGLTVAPLESIKTIDVLDGRKSALGTGAQWGKYGGMIGGALGLGWSLIIVTSNGAPKDELAGLLLMVVPVMTTVGGALEGAMIGTLVGLVAPAKRWRRVGTAELRR
jgi:hypothetical protein